jgi:DNA-binding transcriptional MerR regulator
MEIRLHKNARTTPALRKMIQESGESVSALSKRFGVTADTIYRWKKRGTVEDRSHTRHRLHQSTSLTEEQLICELRSVVGLSIDDITHVMQRCVNPALSRSSIYRCLKRCGVTTAPAKDARPVHQPFEDTPLGFVHVDVKHLTKLDGKRSYAYVAIERVTRYVYVEILDDLKPATAEGFVQRFLSHFPHPVHTILTDNGMEWTDKYNGARVKKGLTTPTGNHPVDALCATRGITRKYTRPFRPQTNGMVERFNRRINEAMAQKEKITHNSGKNTFHSHAERNQFLTQFVENYNNTQLRCLNYQSPNYMIRNHTEYNTKAGIQSFFPTGYQTAQFSRAC